MSIITITLAGRNFKLSCSEENKSHIEDLAEKLDLELNEASKNNPSTSFEMLLVMVSLGLMDNKQSKENKSGGELLEKANLDHKKQLYTIYEELKNVANKLQE